MKTKKWIVSLLSVSTIGAIAPMVTSCKRTNSPIVSDDTPKTREVSANSTRIFFLLKQDNVLSPEDTKVNMINLSVNGASAKPVEGLIRYQTDSAGNILITFNMLLASQHYGAKIVNFDLQLTNKTAKTDYTVTGFEVKVTDKGYAIQYPEAQEIPGIVWDKTPEDTIGAGVDLDLTFKLKKGYEFSKVVEDLDVLVGGASVKDSQYVDFILNEDEQECEIFVPNEYITDDITIKLKTDGKTFNVDQSGILENFEYDALTSIKHAESTTDIKFHPANYYQTVTWDVTMDDGTGTYSSIKNNGAKLVQNDTKLQLDQSKIYGDLKMSAEATPKSYQIVMDETDHLQAVSDSGTYSTDKTITISVKSGYATKYQPSKKITYKCADEHGTEFTKTVTGTVTDQGVGTYVIPGSDIKGKITISNPEEACQYDVDHSAITTANHLAWTGKDKATYGTNYEATLAPENNYYKISTWDVKRNGTSIKDQTPGATWDSTTNKLSIGAEAITGKMVVTATAVGNSWSVGLDKSSASCITTTELKDITYNTAYSETITTDDELYDLEIESATCTDAVSKSKIDLKDKGAITLKRTAAGEKTWTLAITNTYALGEVNVKIKQVGQKFNVQLSGDYDYFSWSGDTGSGAAQHGVAYTATVSIKDTYVGKFAFDADNFAISSGGTSLTKGTDYDLDETKENPGVYDLKIHDDKILGNIVITLRQKIATHTATATKPAVGFETFGPDTGTATYGTDYEYSYKMTDGYALVASGLSCTVTNASGETIDTLTVANNGLRVIDPDPTTHVGQIAVDGGRILGNLSLTGNNAAKTMSINLDPNTIGITAVAGTAIYKGKTVITPTMKTGYILNSTDIEDEILKATVGSTQLKSNVSIEDGKIVIAAAAGVDDDITISGQVTKYSVTVTDAKSAFTKTAPTEVMQDNQYSASFVPIAGYTEPVISSVKTLSPSGEITLTSPDDYTYDTTTGTFVIKANKIKGPVSIELDASAELTWAGTFETKVEIGSTSQYAYSATRTIAPETPVTISFEDTDTTGAKFTANNKIDATAATKAGNVTLTATSAGAKTITKTVNIATPATTKTQFLTKLDAWVSGETGFLNSATTYSKSQLTFKTGETEQTLDSINYVLDDGGNRLCTVTVNETDETYNVNIAGANYTSAGIGSELKEETETGVTYTITDDNITYENTAATELGDYRKIQFNKYGYVTYFDKGGASQYEVIYNGEPVEKKLSFWATQAIYPAGREPSIQDFQVNYNGVDVTKECNISYSNGIVSVDKENETITSLITPSSTPSTTSDTITCTYVEPNGETITGTIEVEVGDYDDVYNNDGEAQAYSSSHSADKPLFIPSRTYNDSTGQFDTITSIRDDGFHNDGQFKIGVVWLPNTIVSIGGYSFGKQESLTQIRIPASVQTIAVNAFDDCDNLTTIYIDSSDIANIKNPLWPFEEAKSVYIKDSIELSEESYIYQNFDEEEESPVEGYKLYTY